MDDVGQSLGLWASTTYLVLGVAYVVTLAAGFTSNRNVNDPLKDPHLAIAEVLILIMAPVMVAIIAHDHRIDAEDPRAAGLGVLAAPSSTCAVHRSPS